MERVVTRPPLEACGDLSATPAPSYPNLPYPQGRALTTHTEQRHVQGDGVTPPRLRRVAALSSLSAGAGAAPSISPKGLAALHGPRPRQCSATPSDPLQFSPSEGVPDNCEYQPAGGGLGAAPRRHRWEAGATGTPSLHSTRDPCERLDRANPWRLASQPINSRPVHRPRPPDTYEEESPPFPYGQE